MKIANNSHNFVYEIPDHSGFGEMEHDHVNIADIFPDKFYIITRSYIERLQKIINKYDVIILMARKAICFYKALVINKEITTSQSCTVYSSRVLNYNIAAKLQGKRIALVDDVVIHGDSLTQAISTLKSFNANVDVYISAALYDERNSNSKKLNHKLGDMLQKPFVHLNQTDIYSYANYITRYIEASMLPYNIDQTSVIVDYEKNDLERFFRDHRITDITSNVQKKYHIQNSVIHYDGEVLRPILGSVNIDLSKVCVKIRIFRDTRYSQLVIFPIILFPVISSNEINHVYEHIQTPKLDALIKNSNPIFLLENKTKVLIYVLNHYLLSRFLWCEREHGRKFTYNWVDSNEEILFSQSILKADFTRTTLYEKICKLKMPYGWEDRTALRQTQFSEYLGVAYNEIFSNTPNIPAFYDANGHKISRKMVTIQTLLESLKKYASFKQAQSTDGEVVGDLDNVDLCAVSNIVDVLIDRGILVPEIVHTSSGEIVRAYRCGEVAKLSNNEFDLFTYMLVLYTFQYWEGEDLKFSESKEPQLITKKELHQLCVLFFRSATMHGLFENLREEPQHIVEPEYYSIYYTVYGPTVSLVGGKKYEVNEANMLDNALLSYRYICHENTDCYKIDYQEFPHIDPKWKSFAESFAYDMLFLKQSFPSVSKREAFFRSQEARSKNPSHEVQLKKKVLSRIRSFEELLTIMAIGENEMQQMLSTLAEMKVIADMRVEKVNQALAYLYNHMNAICEGIWKSRCFVKPELLNETKAMLIQDKGFRDRKDIVKIFQEYVDSSSKVDRNVVIIDFLDKCSEYFYRTYYTVVNINKYSPKPMNLETCCTIPDRIKYDKKYRKLRRSIDQKYNCCSDRDRIKMSSMDMQRVKGEALALLDIGNLYLKHNAFAYEYRPRTIILTANNPDILNVFHIPGREYDFNWTTTGKIDNTRFFRCFAIEESANRKKDHNTVIHENLNALVSSIFLLSSDEVSKSNVSAIFYEAGNWYESIFLSSDTCTGTFVEKIVKEVSLLEEKWGRSSQVEFYLCERNTRTNLTVNSPWFTLLDTKQNAIVQCNYHVSNYRIILIASPTQSNGTFVNGNLVVSSVNNSYSNSKEVHNMAVHIKDSTIGAIVEKAEAGSSITGIRQSYPGIDWEKASALDALTQELQKIKKELASQPDKTNVCNDIDEAVAAISQKDESKLKSMLKKIGREGVNIAEGILGSLIATLITQL